MNGLDNIIIEDAKIFWKNLSGAPDKFNSQGGNRTFCVWIPSLEDAQALLDIGWPIKYSQPRDEQEDPRPYLKVKATYGKVPPNIYICNKHNKTLLDSSTVGIIDNAEIKRVDVEIRPYCYENIAGKSGISAYVKTMYVTIQDDPFADRYTYDEEF